MKRNDRASGSDMPVGNSSPEDGSSKKKSRKKVVQGRRMRYYIPVSAAFLLLIVIFALVSLLSQDNYYSESENRLLAQRPAPTVTGVMEGTFMSDMEDYVADQFFLRDSWITLNLFEDILLGKREVNGVYIGKNNYLFEISDEPNLTAIEKNFNAIADFSEDHDEINMVMTLVPNSVYIMDQYIPANAPVMDQAAFIEYADEKTGNAVDFVNLIETMTEHKDEYIYYKTDHHWTTLGAMYAFEALSPALGIDDPASDFEVYPVTHDFSGTLASSSGYHLSSDTIDIYIPRDTDTDCVVTYTDEDNLKSASVYNSAALETKNKYEVFLGGNYSRIDIAVPSDDNRNLLIFKDSYANCFIPFLIPYYRNIFVIDPRYYYDNIETLIMNNGITDVLFLYNVNTFLTDNTLADVLEIEE